MSETAGGAHQSDAIQGCRRIRRDVGPKTHTIVPMLEPQSSDSSALEVPSLSVVVCTYNRVSLLRRCLGALAQQTMCDQVQIIVVDDGSAQDTGSVVSDYRVDFVSLGTNQGLSAARNAGVARARAPIVAFTDDDVIVPPDWCESVLHAWSRAPANTHAIGGSVSVLQIQSLTQRFLSQHNPLTPIEADVTQATTFLRRLRAYLKHGSEQSDAVRPVFSLVGANMSFNRDSLSAINGFDPTIRFGGDEEYACVEMRRVFGPQSILFDPSISVAHDFDPRLGDTLRRSFQYGISNGRSWARHGGIPGLRPIGGLVTVTLLVGTPFSIVGAFVVAGLIPFVMWRRWIRESLTRRNPEVLSYPLIALAQELWANVGFVVGWRRELQVHRERRGR